MCGVKMRFKRNSIYQVFLFFHLGILLLSSCATPPEQAPGTPASDVSQKASEKASSPSGEVINRIRFVVGDIPITEIDLDRMTKKMRDTGSPEARRNPVEAAKTELFTRALIEIEAKKESILVTEARMQHEVNRRMEASGITDETAFHKTVEKETGMPFDRWVDDLRYQIIRIQVMQIKLSVPQPSDAEIEKFYAQNRDKVGIEVSYREIVLAPRNSSIDEEARISAIARQLAGQITGNPARFAELARTTPENISPFRFNGGFHDYTPISEVAEQDRLTAGVVYALTPGALSPIFRNTGGRYCLVRLEGKRPMPLARVRDVIIQRLYIDKQEEAFVDWVKRRLKEVAITTIP